MVDIEDIFYKHVEGMGTKQSILSAMVEYADVVANERVKYLVAHRNELQQYKSNIEAWLRKAPTEASVKELEESPERKPLKT